MDNIRKSVFDKWINDYQSIWINSQICWYHEGYWIDSDTYEDAKRLFERWAKLKAFD